MEKKIEILSSIAMKMRRKRIIWNRASMECIKFIGVDPTTAGSYNSSHAGSYPSSRVCIPERCFTKCMHCIEFNHPPQKNQFFRPVVPRPFHGCFKKHRKNDRQKDPPLPKFCDIGLYQVSHLNHDRYIYIESQKSNRTNLKNLKNFFIDMISAFNLLDYIA